MAAPIFLSGRPSLVEAQQIPRDYEDCVMRVYDWFVAESSKIIDSEAELSLDPITDKQFRVKIDLIIELGDQLKNCRLLYDIDRGSISL